MKRSGAAGVGGLLGSSMVAGASWFSDCSCPAHGSSCVYVTSMTVTFTETSICPTILNEDNSVEWQASGRRFHGEMEISRSRCGTPIASKKFPVQSGGYRDPHSSVTYPNDTTMPAGEHNMGTQQTPDIPGETPGYNMNGDGRVGGHRSHMEVHEPGKSTGCIAFKESDDWNEFKGLVNKIVNCKHNPPSPIPIKVVYSGVTPVGNNP